MQKQMWMMQAVHIPVVMETQIDLKSVMTEQIMERTDTVMLPVML